MQMQITSICRPRGVSLLELTIVVAVLAVLVAGYFLFYSQRTGFDSDRARAEYYTALGSFLERFTADMQMARRVEIATPACHLEVATVAGVERITYTLLADGAIARERGGRRERFAFGKAPQPGQAFQFRLEEVAP